MEKIKENNAKEMNGHYKVGGSIKTSLMNP